MMKLIWEASDIQVKTRRVRSSLLTLLPLRAPLSDVGAILLAGVQAFFETNSFVLDESTRVSNQSLYWGRNSVIIT